ncbi:Hypothetical predicted protein [Octopus vulgaris]|uniref:Uncharacterized protein n=1 Tax=Octopus vulgaris TaxID=6645 RepID=A0AA36B8V2_OCTVU|nr:Hypothetical predicted protein [Octopus vulgaris]
MNVLVRLEKQLKHLMDDESKIRKTKAAPEDPYKVPTVKENLCYREKSLVCRPQNKGEHFYPNRELQMKKVISVYIEIQNKILPFLKEAVLFSTPSGNGGEIYKTGGRNMAIDTGESKERHDSKYKKSAVTDLSMSPVVRSYRGWNYRGLLRTNEGYYVVINISRKCLSLYDNKRVVARLVLSHEPYGICWFGKNKIVVTASCQKLYVVKLLPTKSFELLHVFRTSIQYSGIDFYSDSHLLAIGYGEPLLKFVSLTHDTTIELTILKLPFYSLKGHKRVHLTSKGDIYIADTSNGIVYCFKPYVGWTSYNIRQPTDVVSLGSDVYISQGFGIDKILRLNTQTEKLSCFLSPKDGLACPCSMAVTNQNGIILACDNQNELKLGFWNEL